MLSRFRAFAIEAMAVEDAARSARTGMGVDSNRAAETGPRTGPATAVAPAGSDRSPDDGGAGGGARRWAMAHPTKADRERF